MPHICGYKMSHWFKMSKQCASTLLTGVAKSTHGNVIMSIPLIYQALSGRPEGYCLF